ncbi:hypothetical protein [Asaia sp. HN010]|uniref:hypothetical protein n=1 Tax=Asaia sp. HN010 TaxID=3081233 RepID=UPI003017E308
MHLLDAPVIFSACAALGFWVAMMLIPKPKKRPMPQQSDEKNAVEPEWDRGSHPHRFGNPNEGE